MVAPEKRVYTLQFWLLCLSLFLFLGSFNLLIPELPAYLRAMGGEQYLGLIISLFALTAGLARPLSGKLTDRIGRIPIIVFGIFISVISGLLYTVVTGIIGFFIIRLLHGLSAGFTPTGNTSLLTDIIPAAKRGQAMGYVGIATSLGMAVGPPVGSWISMNYSHDVLFFSSSASALLALVAVAGIKETLKKKQPFTAKMLIIHKDEVIDRDVMAPSLVMLMTIFSFGLLLTIVPDYSEFLEMENKGVFFTYFLTASLLVRATAGHASDRHGRQKVLKVGVALQLVALVMMALLPFKAAFLAAGVVFGLGSGVISPALFAWTADLAQEHQRGKAMSTLFLALEIGILLGALGSGFLYNNQSDRFPVTFLLGAFFTAFSLYYLLKRWPAFHR
ncbi:MAG: MFS transporter [Cryomorphaceae bacterium]|nr:MAG: MFS transporter [Cryomorphaceae bacterium]